MAPGISFETINVIVTRDGMLLATFEIEADMRDLIREIKLEILENMYIPADIRQHPHYCRLLYHGFGNRELLREDQELREIFNPNSKDEPLELDATGVPLN